jgi:hypothetical protein
MGIPFPARLGGWQGTGKNLQPRGGFVDDGMADSGMVPGIVRFLQGGRVRSGKNREALNGGFASGGASVKNR